MTAVLEAPPRRRSTPAADGSRARRDAGIRLGQFIAADMIAVRLTQPCRLVIVASPAYLARDNSEGGCGSAHSLIRSN